MTHYTLTAAAGAMALVGGGTDGASHADPGLFALAGGAVKLVRSFTADIGDLTLKLDPLKKQISYWDKNGAPTVQGQLHDQRQREAIEAAFNSLAKTVLAIQVAYNAAAQAAAAASEAASTAVQAQAETAAVVETVTAIEDGSYNFPSITVGGAQFAYDGGTGLIIP